MYDTLKYNSFCRKTLKYDTFCRETLKYGTFLSQNVKIRVKSQKMANLRNEPSKDLVSQSLSSKLTCEREMAQKALELLLTAQILIKQC